MPFSNRQSYLNNNNAFDLTWRNYLPSLSEFNCCCLRQKGIQLEDDPIIEPVYYNDHSLYRGESLESYLNNPRDWEFESVLGQSDFLTRNPFIRKKSHRKKHRERSAVMETDMEDGDIAGYELYDDAEFLGDDQIAHLAYHRSNSQVMNPYGQDEPAFYAARIMPDINLTTAEGSKSLVIDESTQSLLNQKLDYIKKNMAQMNQEEDDLFERNTLNTLCPPEERHPTGISDIDSVASEALEVYENTHQHQLEQDTRRYSDELHLPSHVDNTPFVSDQHPFSYFNEQNVNSDSLNVQTVFNLGRKWLGV
ncbi:uncharacterized protein B0P05DRAFT_521286 [Gilbertella persicaria]|uniref:uncharacterized protein n=1 Tax=Gilbertella persicaria TaxID=101096 RepID=UPI00221FD14C|nr:uncharacterized protein B0P05DRAFT_521286 [Gilbertella persicaria]KAI8098296.1 hypothetical protein B0P05DRAFT_521286 [Gilbertella persicaria]